MMNVLHSSNTSALSLRTGDRDPSWPVDEGTGIMEDDDDDDDDP